MTATVPTRPCRTQEVHTAQARGVPSQEGRVRSQSWHDQQGSDLDHARGPLVCRLSCFRPFSHPPCTYAKPSLKKQQAAFLSGSQ